MDPDSCLKEYHEFLSTKKICISLYHDNIRKQLKERSDLCDDVVLFYRKAKLDNEKISFLEDLIAMGYNKNKIAELALENFYLHPTPSNLWGYADLLYSLRVFSYLRQYVEIIQNRSLGEARQMLILLVGKSKKDHVVDVLKSLLDDQTVYGHALDALSNFPCEETNVIMCNHKDCSVDWIRKIAEDYLKKYKL